MIDVIKDDNILHIDCGDEYFEIDGENNVITCISNDIDLNSAPTGIKVRNYISNKYGVDVDG